MGLGKERQKQENYILLRDGRNFRSQPSQLSLFIPSSVALTISIITNSLCYQTTALDLYINHLVWLVDYVIINSLRSETITVMSTSRVRYKCAVFSK